MTNEQPEQPTTPQTPNMPPPPTEPPTMPAEPKKRLSPLAAGTLGLALGASLMGGIWAITANSGPSEPATFTLEGTFTLTEDAIGTGDDDCSASYDSGYDDIAEGTSVTVYGGRGTSSPPGNSATPSTPATRAPSTSPSPTYPRARSSTRSKSPTAARSNCPPRKPRTGSSPQVSASRRCPRRGLRAVLSPPGRRGRSTRVPCRLSASASVGRRAVRRGGPAHVGTLPASRPAP